MKSDFLSRQVFPNARQGVGDGGDGAPTFEDDEGVDYSDEEV
jgi:hypothetical protein